MSTPETHLDPEQLGRDALDPDTYHLVVGPALQVCAALAAKRGDPTLHADMPAMLALVHLVTELGRHWAADHDEADNERLDQAAVAACVMVLREAGLAEDAIGQCLAALEAAYAQLAEHNVTEPAGPFIGTAWRALSVDDRDTAIEQLEQAAHRIVAAIEAWQNQVH